MNYKLFSTDVAGVFLITALCLVSFSGCTGGTEDEFLDDRAKLLLAQETDHLRKLQAAMMEDFDVHFRLVTLAESPDDINMTAAELFGDLGAKTRGAKGLLFLVDLYGRQVRIEVGYDLEHHFPDGFIGYLEQKQMLPFFQAGRIGHGIEATAELLVGRLQRGMAGKTYDPEEELGELAYYSGGGGARMEIGGVRDTKKQAGENENLVFTPQPSPEKALALYKQVLAERIKNPNLPLYTEQTREFFRKWVVTDAQQANELQQLNLIGPEKTFVDASRAVIRFPLRERLHPPYFFENRGAGWQLDFATMSRVLGMNHKNMWHLRTLDHPYDFAFRDWEFDQNGFPIKEKQ
jgi:uncharacterized protein